jgi:DNA-binding NtrC family response regulator
MLTLLVLVIDEDRATQQTVEQAFQTENLRVLSAATIEAGLESVRTQKPDVVLLDFDLSKTSGLEVLKQIKEIDKKLPVILMTVGGTSDSAIDAIMLGAHDYVLKPLDVNNLKDIVTRALESRRLMNVPVRISAAEPGEQNGEQLVGRSPQMQEVYKAIARVAPQDITVLIRGESGTGKELVARAIYQHSARRDGPFLAVNCAAMTETLLESELFGHEKGAFTGADRRRIGKFEQCHGGTIFLDEVGDMSPAVQSKVLRVLQEQKFDRVGGNDTIETNVRIISATNRDLEEMATEGKFRSDLYYRLDGFTIELPPLRDRGEDVPHLLEHFLARFRAELGKLEVDGLAAAAVSLLTAYHWPGNVREMQSVIRQALLNTTGPVVVPDHLPDAVRGTSPRVASLNGSQNGLPESDLKPFIERQLQAKSGELYAETLAQMERYLITRVLKETHGNQSKAAEILGITRGKIRDRIAAFGLKLEKEVSLTEGDA